MSIKAVAQYALGLAATIVGLAAWLVLSATVIHWAVLASAKVLPWLQIISALTLGACVLVLGPMTLLRFTRPWAAIGYFISSIVFGVTAWCMGLLLTWSLWGTFAIVIGLLLFGIGVVPIGFLAAIWNAMWAEAGVLVGAAILTWGARLLAVLLAEYCDEHAGDRDTCYARQTIESVPDAAPLARKLETDDASFGVLPEHENLFADSPNEQESHQHDIFADQRFDEGLAGAPNENEVWQTCSEAGMTAYKAGDYAQAEKLLHAALREAEREGLHHGRLAVSLSNLAHVYEAQGKRDLADPLYKRSLDLRIALMRSGKGPTG